ncbi:M24 family metallopeptidase [Planotetraspora sp. A-T 1434]|uniref:M24 family metallopeptidase n=1 Tax=Planotetraspora sp. A-T 1434 TaxID=2979219 RepID=UPI0021BF141A|nr:M24 family metallopeptidase [Planotetraspora sp. A-T 1434]MCT9930218.1 M24 family metallopeptidase [Planotetraspora sp. A-T 1434]
MIEDVRAGMAEAGADALVLRPSPDFRYLGGRGGGYLVLTPDGPLSTVAAPAEAAALIPSSARRVAVDPEMRASELFALGLDTELMLASAVLAPLRLRKRPEEVAAMRRAASAADAVLLSARELAWFGATERAMAFRLRAVLAETGCEDVISVVVAAGEHTAVAAHTPCDRVINPGDALLVSVCGRWDGYCAEVARVFAVAEPPDDFEAMYSVVLSAQHAALEAVRPGVPAAEPARIAREVIDGSGYGHYAAGRQARGIGLSPEEGPRPASDEVFSPGMTVCLEPGIFLPELFGARVADVVVCGSRGPEPLSLSSPSLHVMDR